MRKLLLLLTVFILSILVACGDSDEDAVNVDKDVSADQEKSAEDDESDVSDTRFETDDYVFEIKEVEQIEGEYGDDVLAVELEFTNNTDEPQDPWMAQGIKAEQETENTVELLSGANGQFPEDYKPDLVEMGDSKVKPGKTVSAVIGFEIEFPGEPVILRDFTMDDSVSFEKIVETE